MSKRLTINEFITKSQLIHGNKYDYNKVNYIRNRDNVIIICPIHGEFSQIAGEHLRGHGCIECGKLKGKSTETFIELSKKIHGDKYDYSNSKYSGNGNKINIICPVHGEFNQIASNHTRGNGCPVCMSDNSGWTYTLWEKAGNESKNFDGFKVYFIKCWNENEVFYKIGKTFNPIGIRFGKIGKRMPYKWILLKMVIGDSRTISELEQSLHLEFAKNKYLPLIKFKGNTECYSDINFKTINKLEGE